MLSMNLNKRRKKLLYRTLILTLAIIIVFFFAVCKKIKDTLEATNSLFLSILNNQTEEFTDHYEKWRKNTLFWVRQGRGLNKLLGDSLDKKFRLNLYLDFFESLTLFLPEIVGRDQPKTYLVLLQNNMELRPTGGFMGSYAKLKFVQGGLEKIFVQDIYVPDGQIPGHVDPPWPIQEAFKQGWWRLRDANWDPDFPKAAKVIDWFFQKGKEEKSDGIIAVNLFLFQDLMKIFGPLKLLDYSETVKAENLYQIVQSYSEVGFFPGSTQKKDILSSLALVFLDKLKNLNKKEILPVFFLVWQNLGEKQILFSFTNQKWQETFQRIGWDGSLKKVDFSSEKEFNDYLFLVETNLGANKANCCVERELEQIVDLTDAQVIRENLKIYFKNQSRLQTPYPPFFWGGNYINFLRIYLPISAERIKVFFQQEEIGPEKMLFEENKALDLQVLGFFVTIPALSQRTVEVVYEYPKIDFKDYHLVIQKQSGIEFLPYTLVIKTSPGSYLIPKEKFLVNEGIYQWQKKLTKDEEVFASLKYN